MDFISGLSKFLNLEDEPSDKSSIDSKNLTLIGNKENSMPTSLNDNQPELLDVSSLNSDDFKNNQRYKIMLPDLTESQSIHNSKSDSHSIGNNEKIKELVNLIQESINSKESNDNSIGKTDSSLLQPVNNFIGESTQPSINDYSEGLSQNSPSISDTSSIDELLQDLSNNCENSQDVDTGYMSPRKNVYFSVKPSLSSSQSDISSYFRPKKNVYMEIIGGKSSRRHSRNHQGGFIRSGSPANYFNCKNNPSIERIRCEPNISSTQDINFVPYNYSD